MVSMPVNSHHWLLVLLLQIRVCSNISSLDDHMFTLEQQQYINHFPGFSLREQVHVAHFLIFFTTHTGQFSPGWYPVHVFPIKVATKEWQLRIFSGWSSSSIFFCN